MIVETDETLIALYNLKTRRQKRRAYKSDKEKALFGVHNRLVALYNIWRNLPMVPLSAPYQKGWKRSFVLQQEEQYGPDAEFYLELLNKINTTFYSNTPKFTKKVRRKYKRKKVDSDMPQFLKVFSEQEWDSPKLNLSEAEKKLFQPQLFWRRDIKNYELKYVFAQPWHFVLKISPNMITEAKLLDVALDAEINKLEQYLKSERLWPVIYRQIFGMSKLKYDDYRPPDEYRNPGTKQNVYAILDALKDA